MLKAKHFFVIRKEILYPSFYSNLNELFFMFVSLVC